MIEKIKTCVYCGEEDATTWIPNPNSDYSEGDDHVWDVCNDCKLTIKAQQKLTFGEHFGSRSDNKFMQERGKQLVDEAQAELKELAERTKKPILSACISKNKDGSHDILSKTYTGEKDEEDV